jgi:hypothetical protein
LFLYYRTATEKTDTDDDLGSHPARINSGRPRAACMPEEAIKTYRYNHKQSRTE